MDYLFTRGVWHANSLAFVVVNLVILGFLWLKILGKMEYSEPIKIALLIGLILPFFNLVVMCILAFTDWPALIELRILRRGTNRVALPQASALDPEEELKRLKKEIKKGK